VYAQGRDALETAVSKESDANMHELRKRAKDLLYTGAFLRKASPYAKSLLPNLDRFTDLLGLDHDLAILRRAATRQLVRNEPLRRRLSELALRRQTLLRRRAWRIGSRVYCDSPTVYMRQIHKDWKNCR
jgi:hypothetical protein